MVLREQALAPIHHTFYWCSKLHFALNRAINIKNIRQATTNNIGYSNSLRASGCFLCLSPYIFSEWHIVPLLYIQIKLSRACSRKALYGCKASRRLGKYIRGFNCFCQSPAIYSYNNLTDKLQFTLLSLHIPDKP